MYCGFLLFRSGLHWHWHWRCWRCRGCCGMRCVRLREVTQYPWAMVGAVGYCRRWHSGSVTRPPSSMGSTPKSAAAALALAMTRLLRQAVCALAGGYPWAMVGAVYLCRSCHSGSMPWPPAASGSAPKSAAAARARTGAAWPGPLGAADQAQTPSTRTSSRAWAGQDLGGRPRDTAASRVRGSPETPQNPANVELCVVPRRRPGGVPQPGHLRVKDLVLPVRVGGCKACAALRCGGLQRFQPEPVGAAHVIPFESVDHGAPLCHFIQCTRVQLLRCRSVNTCLEACLDRNEVHFDIHRTGPLSLVIPVRVHAFVFSLW